MFGVTLGIWAKITGIEYARFNKESFDCVIKGDGTIQHYYVEGVYPFPILRVFCTLNETKTAEMAEMKKSNVKVE